jgi:CRISPR-associated protein Cmr6
MIYLTPTDTASLLQNNANKCHNLALILGRYIPKEVINNEDVPAEKKLKYRSKWMQEVVSRFRQDVVGKSVAAYHQRWQRMTEAAAATAWEMTLLTRLIVGLGGKGALEIGITLDKVTGLPYIPGSALKGACRSYALYEIAARHGINVQESDALKNLDEKLATGKGYNGDARLYAAIFGSQDDAGALVFFDAVVSNLADNKSLFALDVMTPHFPRYYRDRGNEAPADNDSPNPVNFITVTHGTTFAFAVGIRASKRADSPEDARQLQETAKRWLITALSDYGVGSKTAAGYGAFREVTKPS